MQVLDFNPSFVAVSSFTTLYSPKLCPIALNVSVFVLPQIVQVKVFCAALCAGRFCYDFTLIPMIVRFDSCTVIVSISVIVNPYNDVVNVVVPSLIPEIFPSL